MSSLVSIDLGASSSRYCSDSGIISVVPNNMVFLPTMETSRIQSDAADIESNLEVQIVKHEANPNETPLDQQLQCFPVNVLVGIMAEKHRNVNIRPDLNLHKHEQMINYISAVLAVAISKVKYGLDENIDLYLAMPPIEVEKASVEFKRRLLGTYTVTFPKFNGGTTVEFTISDVQCSAESLMACTSFFFNGNGSIKDNAKKYMQGTVLSLDIGASTTDLAIIRRGQFLDKTGKTYKVGGNVARDNLGDMITEQYAFDLPIADLERTMSEGRLQLGNNYADVSELVNAAKLDLAKRLIQHMQTYFKQVNIPIQTINTIVVSGGGSMQSQYIDDNGEIVKTSEPMSYFVTQQLTEDYSKGTEVVPYGEEARFANIKGLFIKAKFDNAKKAQERALAQQAMQLQGNAVTTDGQ